MTVNGNSVNIAAEGPHHSLRFYWAVNGSPTWHAEKVAGAGTTFSAPSMTVNGNSVNIAAEGPNHSLRFYWAVNGSSTWHAEKVAGGGHDVLGPVGHGQPRQREHRRRGWRAAAQVLLGGQRLADLARRDGGRARARRSRPRR